MKDLIDKLKSSVLMKIFLAGSVIHTILHIIAWLVALFFIFGCTSDKVGFADEEYIWDNWTVSTNRIEIIKVEF